MTLYSTVKNIAVKITQNLTAKHFSLMAIPLDSNVDSKADSIALFSLIHSEQKEM